MIPRNREVLSGLHFGYSCSMQRVTADLFPLGGPIQELGNAQQTWRERRGLWLRLRAPDGSTGWGEASPLPGYSAESLAEAQRDLEAWKSEPRSLIAEDEWGGLDLAFEGGCLVPSARCAIETAWLDLLARQREQPLWHLLGGKPEESLPVAALITELEPTRAVEQAQKAEERGLVHFKFKVGRTGKWAEELRVLRALRDSGRRHDLRLDANQALPASELFERLRELAEFEPEFIEEPVPLEALEALVERGKVETLRRIGVPLALDESLQAPDTLQRLEPLLASGCCRSLVLKPMALGGTRVCLRLAQMAHGLGIATLVTHLFDGPVAWAAYAALALALPGERLACGLDFHAALSAWPKITQPSWGGGRIHAHELPGLGIEVER